VGYFKFSLDEMERQKQLQELNLLREETRKQRQQKEQLEHQRTSAIQTRLERLREKKAKYSNTSMREPRGDG
jgi:type II secretory pathway component HofQ